MKWIFVSLISILLFSLHCGDRRPPDVSITVPDNGSSVSGIATIMVIVQDNVEVDSVVLYIDEDIVQSYKELPYLYSWNTHILVDDTEHTIEAYAYDDAGNEGSDSIRVTIGNGPLIFADDFESYIPGLPPSEIWSEIWPGVVESVYIAQGYYYQGVKSFHSFGYAQYIRTDGIHIDISDLLRLVYRVSMMVPQSSNNGAILGFFNRLDSLTGEIVNGVMLYPGDHRIHVRGYDTLVTAFTWSEGTWYEVQVEMDFSVMRMDVYIDSVLVAGNVYLADTALLDTFALSTVYGWEGGVLYDDVRISRE